DLIGTCVPAAGDCESTVPGSWSEACWVRLYRRPALLRSCCASLWILPTSLGTSTCWVPLDTVSVIVCVVGTSCPSSGLTEITWLTPTSPENLYVFLTFLKPAALSALVAAFCPSPVTDGIVARSGPLETVR